MNTEGSDMDKDNLMDDAYLPRIFVGGTISHYYGDYIRRVFVAIALVLLVSAPFIASDAPVLFIIATLTAFILIGLSAFTNPKSKSIMIANAAVAAVGIVLFEIVALAAFKFDATLLFVGSEAMALILASALYMSLKTVRAMQLHQIGKRDLPGEFMVEKFKDAREQR
jgi:peptidoglycan/LPS O-acetylase OafA/YrhL